MCLLCSSNGLRRVSQLLACFGFVSESQFGFELQATPSLFFCTGDLRLSHQIDVLLGALQLCQTLGRALVVPPLLQVTGGGWHEDVGLEHREVDGSSIAEIDLVPFDHVFNTTVLREKVGTTSIAAEQQQAFCSKRHLDGDAGLSCKSLAEQSALCSKVWSSLKIRFDTDRPYDHLLGLSVRAAPGSVVLTQPGAFPVPTPAVNKELQALLPWSDRVQRRATSFLRSIGLRTGSYVAVHFNAKLSWSRFCKRNASVYNPLFEDCAKLGEHVPADACDPHRSVALAQLSAALRRSGACQVAVLTGIADLGETRFEERLDPTDLEVDVCDGVDMWRIPHRPGNLVDVAAAASVAARAAGFIGYCCSRLSGLIAREREVVWGRKHETWLWGLSSIRSQRRGKGSSKRGAPPGSSKRVSSSDL
mmetsp:Transcript_2989/g.10191  ORF Transcript_2989/g.10191 Transcript_2989/m.10191 type:complete len:419 (-) Transcript_2989:103-1359(-)